jgi:hypothetical protein
MPQATSAHALHIELRRIIGHYHLDDNEPELHGDLCLALEIHDDEQAREAVEVALDRQLEHEARNDDERAMLGELSALIGRPYPPAAS